jgi:hypothetical protein
LAAVASNIRQVVHTKNANISNLHYSPVLLRSPRRHPSLPSSLRITIFCPPWQWILPASGSNTGANLSISLSHPSLPQAEAPSSKFFCTLVGGPKPKAALVSLCGQLLPRSSPGYTTVYSLLDGCQRTLQMSWKLMMMPRREIRGS